MTVRVRTLEDAKRILRDSNFVHPQQVVDRLMRGLDEESPVLSVAEGEIWQRTHNAVARFFTPRAVAGYAPTITRIVEEVFDAIIAAPRS